MKREKSFLPHTPLGWAVTVVLTLIAAFFSMYPLARVTDQRFGMVVVSGYSLHDIIPYGSSVVVLPLPAREGQVVSAWAPEGIDNPETDEDRRPTPVLKVLRRGLLVSTNFDQTISKYEIRGVVVAVLPPLPWMRGENEDPSMAEEQRRRFALAQVAGGLILQGDQEKARAYLNEEGHLELFTEALRWAKDEKQRRLDEEFVREDNPWSVRITLPNGPAKISKTYPVPDGDWQETRVVLQATAGSSCTVDFGGNAIVLNGSDEHIVAVPAGAKSVTYTLETFGEGESIAILQVGGIPRAR